MTQKMGALFIRLVVLDSTLVQIFVWNQSIPAYCKCGENLNIDIVLGEYGGFMGYCRYIGVP